MKPDLSKLTVREANDLWAEVWADQRTKSTHQLRAWEYKRWERHTSNPPIGAISRETLIEFRESAIASGLAVSSVETAIMAVYVVLNEAVRRKVIDEVPRRPRRLRSVPTRCPAATLAEFNKFCAAVCASQYPRHIRQKYRTVYWRAFLGALYFTGLRLGDVEQLKWSQVRSDEITIVAQKTGRTQTIPVHPVLRKLLDVLRVTPVANWGEYPGRWKTRVMLSNRRERVFAHSRKLTHHAFWDIRKATGLPKFSAQCVRKLAARQYEASHGGAGGILLGHSLGVTGFYLSSVEILKTAQTRLAIPECFADLALPQTDIASVFSGLSAAQQQVVLSILATMGVKA